MTILGASLLVLLNALGVFLLLAGLVIMVYIVGGPGFGMGNGGRSGGGKRSMQEAEARQEEEERKRRRGEDD